MPMFARHHLFARHHFPFLSLLLVLGLGLSLAAAGRADPLPLKLMPSKSFSDVQAEAAYESVNGPVYSNSPDPKTLPFHATLTGTVTADATMNKLAILSDDGCDVLVDGVKVWNTKDQGQALPDLPNSLHELPGTLSPGSHTVEIDYSNVIYGAPDPTTGQPVDIDGCTLFVYGGAPPVVTLTADDPGDPDEFQQVTSKVYASVDHLPAGHSASDLTATWTWTVVGVTHSDTVDGTYTTDGVDAALFSVTGDNADLTSPTATFKGEFDLDGFYEVEVAGSVVYHDNRTGEDLGPYGGPNTPADIYLGDTGDEPPPASTAAPNMTPAAVVTMRPNQVSGPPPQGTKLHNKVSIKHIVTTIAIDGMLSSTAPGGLVIPPTDGNGAQRQKITVNVSNTPSDWFADRNTGRNFIRILRNNSKVEIYTNPRGGQPLVYSGPGADNDFAVNQLFPLTLYVEGASSSTPSDTMRDVNITAQAFTQQKADGPSGNALFTVLWVNPVTASLGNGSTFSTDDVRAAFDYNKAFASNIVGGPQLVGGTPSRPFYLYSWVYEAQGTVHPSNFSWPLHEDVDPQGTNHEVNYNHLHLARDVEGYFYYHGNVFQPEISKDWNVPYSPNDTDLPDFQSDDTSALGKIYDIDGPGYNTQDNWAEGETHRLRFNARMFAEILAQGKLTRCSTITGLYIRTSGIMKNGTPQPATDVPNDNRAGFGITSVASDLKPVAPTGLNASSPQSKSVNLSWQASETATSYNVYYSNNSTQAPQRGGPYSTTNLNYSLVNLQPGVAYYFEVAGVNSFGEGPKSAEASATP